MQSRYRIVRRLGSGGMGAVYEAEDTRLKNRLVALKETFADDDDTRQAFEREAEILANTEHEAFPRVIDYFTEMDGCFLVMELIRGEDLAESLSKRSEPFPEEEVLEWTDQILDALEDLHAQKIIHRDIKPSNLKLTRRGRIKLLDFGIAKNDVSDITAVTTVGSLAGVTLQYAPIEQVLRADANFNALLAVNFGEKVDEIVRGGTDARSDLYTLGVTVYQLLTRRLPKNAPTRAAAIWSGHADKLVPASEVNPQISQAVSDVLQIAMALERRERPSSAAEMRRMLRKARAENLRAISPPVIPDSSKSEIPTIPAPKKAPPLSPVYVKSDDGRFTVNISQPKFSGASPKFETFSGAGRQTRLVLAIMALIALGGVVGFKMWQGFGDDLPNASKQATAQAASSEKGAENKSKQTSAQPKNQPENFKTRTEFSNSRLQSDIAGKPENDPDSASETETIKPSDARQRRRTKTNQKNRDQVTLDDLINDTEN